MERNNRMTTRLLTVLCGLVATNACSRDAFDCFGGLTMLRGRPKPTRSARALPVQDEPLPTSADKSLDKFRGAHLATFAGAKKAATAAAVGVGYATAVTLCHTPAAPVVMGLGAATHKAMIAKTAASAGTTFLWTNRQAERTQEIVNAKSAENAELPPRADRPSVEQVQDQHYATSYPWDLPVHRDAQAVIQGTNDMQLLKQKWSEKKNDAMIYRAIMELWTQEFWRGKRATDAELLQTIDDGKTCLEELAQAQAEAENDLLVAEDPAELQQRMDRIISKKKELVTLLEVAREEYLARDEPSTYLACTELVEVSQTCGGDETLYCGYKQGHDPKGVIDWRARNIVKMLPLSGWRCFGAGCAHLPIGPRELVVAYFNTVAGKAFTVAHPFLAGACLFGPSPAGWGGAIQPFTTWAFYEIGEQLSKATTWYGECCIRGTCCCLPRSRLAPANEFIRWRQGPIHRPTIQSEKTHNDAQENMNESTPEQRQAVEDAIKAFDCQSSVCQSRGECWALEKLQSDLGMSFPTLPHGTDMNDTRMRADDHAGRHWRTGLLRQAVLEHIMANEFKLGAQVEYTTDVHGDCINMWKLGALLPKSSLYYTDDQGVQQYGRVVSNEDGDYYGDHQQKVRLEIFSSEDANGRSEIIELAPPPPRCTQGDESGQVEIARTRWEHELLDRFMQSPGHNFHNKHYMQLWAAQYIALSEAINALGLAPKDPRPSTGGHH